MILQKHQLFEQYFEFVAFQRTGTYSDKLSFVFFVPQTVHTCSFSSLFFGFVFVLDFLTNCANTKIVTEQPISFFRT